MRTEVIGRGTFRKLFSFVDVLLSSVRLNFVPLSSSCFATSSPPATGDLDEGAFGGTSKSIGGALSIPPDGQRNGPRLQIFYKT